MQAAADTCEHAFMGKPRMCGKCGTRAAPLDVAVDVVTEHRRIDAAIDAGPLDKIVVEATTGCHVCGAPPGSRCVSNGPGPPLHDTPHQRRIDDYRAGARGIPQTGAALATTPDTSEVARRGLQQAIKVQILAFCDQEITAKTLSRLQRFCASMGQAMVGLEKPDALVRDRFGKSGFTPIGGGYYPSVDLNMDSDGDLTMAPSPGIETYGANASRSLIAEAAKIGKDIIEAQAAGQKASRRVSSLPELVASLVLAKKQKLGKAVISALEKQIADANKDDASVPGGV